MLTIEDPEIESRVALLARATGESATEVIRRALDDRSEKLGVKTPETIVAEWRAFMEENYWSKMPPGERGRGVTKEEREEMLGYGPDGV